MSAFQSDDPKIQAMAKKEKLKGVIDNVKEEKIR